jgi:hypothetical protein
MRKKAAKGATIRLKRRYASKNGLVVRSMPIVVSRPWPQTTRVSSG